MEKNLKNNIYVCVNVYVCVCLVAQLCPTLCDPMDYSSPGSSVPGDSPGKNTGVSCRALLQGGCSQPRDRTCIFRVAGRFFTYWATREAPLLPYPLHLFTSIFYFVICFLFLLIDPVSLYSLLSLMLMCIFIVLSHSAFLFLIIVLTAEVFPKTIFIKFPSPRALFSLHEKTILVLPLFYICLLPIPDSWILLRRTLLFAPDYY